MSCWMYSQLESAMLVPFCHTVDQFDPPSFDTSTRLTILFGASLLSQRRYASFMGPEAAEVLMLGLVNQ